MQIDIYTTRNAEALKAFIASMKSRARSYTTTINDAICQLYRVEHDIDNFVQVDLFEATEEMKAAQ
jgi:FMN-dependent NADH-azoreductase